jgi:hypothetical protein
VPGSSPGALAITIPQFTAFSLVPLALGLLAVAALVYGWHLALLSERWWLAAIATPFLTLYAWLRLTSVFDRVLVRVANGEVFVEQSRFWPTIRLRVRSDRIRQLFSIRAGYGYAVAAHLDDKTAVLLRPLRSPHLALYFERQIEHALGIHDQPRQNEIGRNQALPSPPSRAKPLVFDAVFLSIMAGVPLLFLQMCGTELAELAVTDQPSEISFDVKRPGRIYFTAEVDVTDHDWRSRSDIPHSFNFHIEVLRDTNPIAKLVCDPFELFVWVSGSSGKRVDSFWGPMDSCAVHLREPGTYTLRAWRNWKPGMPRIRLDETNLAPRQD